MSAQNAGDTPVESLQEQTARLTEANDQSSPERQDKVYYGAVFVWERANGWTKVPNSVLPGNNGIELSRDGMWAYVNSWNGKSMTYMPLAPSLGESREIELGFMADNIRRSYDGKLVSTGQIVETDQLGRCLLGDESACLVDYRAVEIDPKTFEVAPLFEGRATRDFSLGTTGLKTRDSLWLGSARSNCIARVALSDRD